MLEDKRMIDPDVMDILRILLCVGWNWKTFICPVVPIMTFPAREGFYV